MTPLWRLQRTKSYVLFVLLFVALALLTTGCASRAAVYAGSGWPGVALGEDVVYLAVGYYVYAVDPADGSLLWRYPEEAQGGGGLFGSAPSQYWSTPALTDDGILVIGDYTNTLHAFQDDGNDYDLLWTYPTERARFVGSATIADDVVYAASVDGRVHAIDLATGDPLPGFDFQAEADIWAAPLLVEDVLYVAAMDHRLYALDPETGAEQWRFDTGAEGVGGALVGTPTYHEGVLYFGALNNTVYALDAATQAVLWTYPTANWVWGSPAVVDGILVGSDLDGNVFGLDAASGRELWLGTVGGPVVSTPMIVDGLAYFTCEDHNLYIWDAATGEEVQRPVEVEVEFTNRFLFINTGTEMRGVPLHTAPVLVDDMILIAISQGNQLMVALDQETQSVQWRFDSSVE